MVSYFQSLKYSGYATDPKYAEGVKTIFKGVLNDYEKLLNDEYATLYANQLIMIKNTNEATNKEDQENWRLVSFHNFKELLAKEKEIKEFAEFKAKELKAYEPVVTETKVVQ